MNSREFRAAYTLSSNLPYHNFGHAMHVLTTAHKLLGLWRALGTAPEVDEYVLDAACLFHDVGYIPMDKKNEARSAKLALEVLDGGFSQLNSIVDCIRDTETHTPRSAVSSLLCDADLSDLCDEARFQHNNELLRAEFPVSDAEWHNGRNEFLRAMLLRAEERTLFTVPLGDERNERAERILRHALIIMNG
jgi:predicted metal-dependent HD superfamily phosphohydrolase